VSTRACPICGSQAALEARFCDQCGARLPLAGEAAPTGGTPPTALPPSAPPAPRPTTVRGPTGAHLRPTPPPSDLVGQVLDGRYAIERKLGEGGMSYVYLGHDTGADRRYAIKIVSPASLKDDNAMARLRREAALGMRLEHPNVCHIVRLGETPDGVAYVVMPYIEGEVLADRRHREGVLPLATTVAWVSDIAAGLHVAHELAIVHRDLKPENVMITPVPDGTERAVVMDFGLAKERRHEADPQKLTATGIVLGTPEFLSPEQLRGRPLDARSDIYALALLTYEMLCGQLPFEGKSMQEMMLARLRHEPIPLRQRRPDLRVPPAVEQVLARGMAREPEARFASAPEFASALTEAARPDQGPASGGLLGRFFGR
jgi:serine/threonine protein kinase